jgi:hypothetical protein
MTGMETAIATAVAGQLTKFGWDVISKNEFLNQEIYIGKSVQDILYHFYQQYAKNYRERHGQVSVLRMSKAMDLESIYVNVQCLDDFARDYLIDSVTLERRFRETNQRQFRYNFERDKRKDGLTFANDAQYLMVFGGPGIGKSTFLRKVGLEALKGNQGNYQHRLIPVFLELKKFKESEINIQAFIEKEFTICGFPDVQENVSKKLKKGELLILLDGLDEVPTENRENVIDKIQDFVDLHKKNRFILSCRTAARTTNLNRFINIEVAEFDDQQIKAFIEHWFSSQADQEAEIAKNCWELLTQSEYKAAKNLAHTPLLLTFLCLTYRRTLSFQTNRSSLYERALRIFLEEWSAENQLTSHRNLVYKDLNIDLEEGLLSEIAYINFLEDHLFLEKRELVKQIKTHLQQNLNAPQTLDGEKVLKTIELEQGILVEQASDVYSFSHLTLQEYLTARYIVENDLYENIVKNYLTETRWKEVFLLVAGLLRGKVNQLFKADHLLLAMEKEANHYLKTTLGQKLIPILQWADEMTKNSVDSPIKPLGRRAYAYVYAIAYAIAQAITYAKTIAEDNVHAKTIAEDNVHANNNAYAYAKEIATYIVLAYAKEIVTYTNVIKYTITILTVGIIYRFVTLANLFAEDQIFSNVNIPQLIADLQALEKVFPNNKASKKECQKFIDELFKTWNTAFALTPELLNLSDKELEEIDKHYFYINRLILDCKKVAVNISPTVWQEIEDRMLRVP